MQTTLIPMGICYKIEMLMRRFLWGGTTQQRATSPVSWDKVTTSIDCGGLGLKILHQMNLAFMAKLGWRLLQEKQCLWANVLSGKYMRNHFTIPYLKFKSGASSIWNGILKALPLLTNGMSRLIGDGNDVLFWLDRWVDEQPLSALLLLELTFADLHEFMADYWTNGVGWNWPAFQTFLPS